MSGYDVNELLMQAHQKNASDLHLTVASPPICRVNGDLEVIGQEQFTPAELMLMAEKIIPEHRLNEFIEKGEIDCSYSIPNVSRYRVNAYHQRNSVGIAIRIITDKIPSFEELKMPLIVRDLVLKPQGLILVTGPTGSGKSTTLAAMIDFINHRQAKHIITLEDPIEYLHQHERSIVNQREIGLDTHSFSSGLRAALRQDPDIILVGEMRDLETISTAITAAETGHLVLATLHTSGAAQTVDRIIDVFEPHQQGQIRVQLASVLQGVVSQRLFPKLNGKGRVAATEVLMNTPSIANLIRSGKTYQIPNVLQMSRADGMHTLSMSIQVLLAAREVAMDDVKFYLNNGGFE
ncbi:type IV pilus twitching motility protein PilT [Jeotgalibacillus soli]|uniref:Bacterial type II secretion system protein E domain-containing protein n=1 Tax=Jeotgalibacillus soli TaxID=889306 RepID=A0A0C2V6H5_9BACL|nr:type IV pilus twitching motility protein PilT [Jeotgalibacillus soli]KIL44567.1 hypothetical protein KP78_35310 [Jeotgalibacillus soli]